MCGVNMAIVLDSIYDNRKIKIDDNVIAEIVKFRQLSIRDNEAGGILVGREVTTNENLIIEFNTVPYPKDVRRRGLFKRKDPKHIEFYNKLYDENFGIYAYVGEWHTHPEKTPSYSSIDMRGWKKNSNDCNKLSETFIYIIVGTEDIAVWEYNYVNKKHDANLLFRGGIT